MNLREYHMNRLIIIGAGGHGKVIADIASKIGYSEITFLDDNAVGECMGLPIIGKSHDIDSLNDGRTDFVIGIGNNSIRKMIAERYNVNWVTLIHPAAQIAMNVSVGKGTVVMAGVVVNVCTEIGDHCIINTSSVVEHDNVIADYVHISPNSALGGTVTVGECTHIGIGATVKNNITICKDCIVGAGAVVVKNISESGTYIGVPARKFR